MRKGGELVKDNFDNYAPICAFVVVYKAVAQTGNHTPRNFRVFVFEVIREQIYMLANIIKRGLLQPIELYNRPLGFDG